MSHQPGSIEVLAPVSTVAAAAAAAGAGAHAVDVGGDEMLAEAIRNARLDVQVCGPGPVADLSRDTETALRTGARLLCTEVAEAIQAVRGGIGQDRIVVQVTPGELAAATPAGWRTLVDLDGWAQGLTRAEAVAAVCAWLGVSMIRTRHVAEIRRCLDMTESILGTRPPAWAVRGLA
jgi:hypothetical protein